MPKHALGTVYRRAVKRVDRRAIPVRAAYAAGVLPAEAIALSHESRLLYEAVRLANNLA